MLRSGTVVQEETRGVLVRFDRLAACAGCAACGRDKQSTTIFVHGEAAMGDVVSVEMPEAQILRASLLTYLLPLSGFIAGLFLGNALGNGSEGMMALGGITGLILCTLALLRLDKRLGQKTKWQAHVLSVNDPEAIREVIAAQNAHQQE